MLIVTLLIFLLLDVRTTKENIQVYRKLLFYSEQRSLSNLRALLCRIMQNANCTDHYLHISDQRKNIFYEY